MINLIQKKSLKFFHPLLKRLAKLYLAKPRTYNYEDITMRVMPGVFHPGLFFSTKIFLDYLKTVDLEGKSVLELGAGSGLISLFCCKRQAKVTATDINLTALNSLRTNAERNNCKIHVIESDLFENISPSDFDIILINPPYYPKNPGNISEKAWFCGEEFEYFHRLFSQLNTHQIEDTTVLMILSEDCDLSEIFSICHKNEMTEKIVFEKTVNAEKNFIYSIN